MVRSLVLSAPPARKLVPTTCEQDVLVMHFFCGTHNVEKKGIDANSLDHSCVHSFIADIGRICES